MAASSQQLGEIQPETLYPLSVFKAVSGLKSTALRTARQNGLPVRYLGGRAFILGGDFIQHVSECGKLHSNSQQA